MTASIMGAAELERLGEALNDRTDAVVADMMQRESASRA